MNSRQFKRFSLGLAIVAARAIIGILGLILLVDIGVGTVQLWHTNWDVANVATVPAGAVNIVAILAIIVGIAAGIFFFFLYLGKLAISSIKPAREYDD